jgi:hypothetical protein
MYSDSRYSDGYFLKANDARTTRNQISVYRRFPSYTTSFYYYSWLEGDRIDVLASKIYGDSDRWWNIMDANPEIIDPMNIIPGTLIRVPNA